MVKRSRRLISRRNRKKRSTTKKRNSRSKTRKNMRKRGGATTDVGSAAHPYSKIPPERMDKMIYNILNNHLENPPGPEDFYRVAGVETINKILSLNIEFKLSEETKKLLEKHRDKGIKYNSNAN